MTPEELVDRYAELVVDNHQLEEKVNELEMQSRRIAHSAMDKIDMQQSEIEHLLRLLLEWSAQKDAVGWEPGGGLYERTLDVLRHYGER